MFTNESSTRLTRALEALGPLDSPSSGPTLTIQKQKADAFVAAIDALAEALPAFEKRDANVKRAHASVPIEFISSVVAMVEQNAIIRSHSGIDPAAATDTLQFLDAFAPVLKRVAKLAEQLRDALDSKRSELVDQTLTTYAAVKRLAQCKTGDKLVFKDMQRDLGKKRRAKKETAPQAPSSPAPATPSAPKPEGSVAPHATSNV